ncbi:MAG: hypothetical protein HZA16_01000 [Nitrospirae bacterium]|nr:hypothetical protein [Nitrospirota bacterium]
MLVVGLRAPLGLLLRDSWFYERAALLPYEFGPGSAFITTTAVLLTIFALLIWTDRKRRFKR